VGRAERRQRPRRGMIRRMFIERRTYQAGFSATHVSRHGFGLGLRE